MSAVDPRLRAAPALIALAFAVSAALGAGPVHLSGGASGPPQAAAGPPASGSIAPHVPGEVIVAFRDGVDAAERDAILADLGADRGRALASIGAVEARISGLSVEQALARYRGDPRIDFIEPNYLWTEDVIPHDPLFDQQWPLRNTGQTGGTPGVDIRAEAAWDVFTGSRDVVVAVIDTGIDYTHPDLLAQLWRNPGEIPGNRIDDDGNGLIDDTIGWDFINGDNDPLDDRGHGTHVAGTIAAVGDNGVGISGVAWRATLLPLKFLGSDGVGSTLDAVQCIDYAVDAGVDLMNNSWGGGPYSEALRRSIARAESAGILFVAAAGNEGLNTDVFPHYPAAYDLDNIISVAATDHDDQLAGFSNWGAETVDLAAPGVDVLSTLPGEAYGFLSGTSMATPHVSGALVLLMGLYPDLEGGDARALLLSRVHLVPWLQGATTSGGRLDALLPIAVPDHVPPAPVSDLAVVDPDATHVDLVWTATGDDGTIGRAGRYDLRVSTEPIDEAGFDLAARVPAPHPPAPAGQPERVRVEGLAFATTYHFAVRAIDELGNGSPLSNPASGATLGPPDLSASPAEVSADLLTGGTASRPLVLSNAGPGEGRYELFLDGGPGPPIGGGLVIAILTSGGSVGSIRASLAALPDVDSVDVVSVGGELPPLGRLLDYDAVILTTVIPPADPVGLGDLLADYADTGAGVVLTLASLVTGWNPAGRLLDEGYLPFPPGNGPAGSSTLGEYDASHPILQGVTIVEGDLLGELEPAAGANVLAWWANGQPMVATRGRNVVGVNVHVANPETWEGHAPRLLANAAWWSAHRAAWLSVAPATGAVPGDGELELAVTFDAAELPGGDYTADIVVTSDDPDEPEILVPARLRVTTAPDIRLSHDRLDFDTVFVGQSAERYFVVENAGFEPLEVQAPSIDHADFTIDSGAFSLDPGEGRAIAVTWSPGAAGDVATTLVVASDDPDEPVSTIELAGRALIPPSVRVEPAAVQEDLFTGQVAMPRVEVHNDGGSDLPFSVTVRRDDEAAPPGPEAPGTFVETFEDGSLDGWEDGGGVAIQEVTDATAAAGTRFSFHAYGSPSSPSHFRGIYRELDGDPPAYIGFWVRSGSRVTYDGYFVVRDADGYSLIAFWTDAEGRFSVNPAVGGNRSFRYAEDTWYRVEFRDLDYQARTFDYWVDGVLRAGDVPFAHPDATRPARIDLYNFTTFAEAWWDEIRVLPEEPPLWISALPLAGVTPPGGSRSVDLRVDAAGLVGGTYRARLLVDSNDPDEPRVTVPVTVMVTGAPQIHTSATDIDFGTVFLGGTVERTISVVNEGTDVLVVQAAGAEPADYEVAAAPFALSPGDERPLPLTFRPGAAGEIAGLLTLTSNDPDEPTTGVTLAGRALEPPGIAIDPPTLDVTVPAGGTTDVALSVSNPGANRLEADLAFEPSRPQAADGATALVIEDVWPWFSLANQRILDAAGIATRTIESSELASTSLDRYRLVVVPSDQPTSCYETLDANRADLWRFVAAGGVLEVHAAGWGNSNGDASLLVLPGDVRIERRLATVNHVIEPGHPFVEGVPETLGGAFVSHAVLSNLPQQALRIVADDQGDTTLAVWRYGAGTVVAGGLTFEYGWEHDRDTGTILAAMLPLDHETAPDWLHVVPDAVSVAPGATSDVVATLDASLLLHGRLEGNVVARTNIPSTPEVVVPVTLRVEGRPRMETEPASLSFGAVFVGGTEASPVTVRNGGTRVLRVGGIAVEGEGFSAPADGFDLQPSESRAVPVTFAPAGVGASEGSLTIRGDDPDVPAVEIPVTGDALAPPVMEVAPSSLSVRVEVGAVAGAALALSNTGDNDLVFDVDLRAPGGAPLSDAPVTLAPAGGRVPPGEAVSVAVAVDATGLTPGVAAFELRVTGNDPLRPAVTVPLTVDVFGIPRVSLQAAAIDFGGVWIGQTRARTLTVLNVGTDTLEVGQVRVEGPGFAASADPFQVGAAQARNLVVSFVPAVDGPAAGRLVLSTNDPVAGEVVVPLAGVGVVPPRAVVDPASVDATAFTGFLTSRSIELENDGGDRLEWTAELVGGAPGGSLEAVRDALDAGYAAITARIPFRFEFSGGENGYEILDGGLDMYDRGNVLGTDLGGPLSYTGGEILAGGLVGPAGRYFTRKYPGLFVLVADLDRVDAFSITGQLGSGGLGQVDGTVLESTVGGVVYRGFVKRVWDTSDPSVNHLVIVVGQPQARQEFPAEIWRDDHTVRGLSGETRIYDLLYAGRYSGHIGDAATRAILETFLDVLPEAPPWASIEPRAGSLLPGQAVELDLGLNLDPDRPPGEYSSTLALATNDPDRPLLEVPITLSVQDPPVAVVEPDGLFVVLPPGSDVTRTRTMLVSNEGAGPLVWSVETPAWAAPEPFAGTLAAGASVEVRLAFSAHGLAEGEYAAPARLRSNDPVHETLDVALRLRVREEQAEWTRVDPTPRAEDGLDVVEVTVQLPAPLDPRRIVVPSVKLWGELPALDPAGAIGDRDRDGHPDVTFRFDGHRFASRLAAAGGVVVVTGEVRDEAWFRGSAELRGAPVPDVPADTPTP